LEGQQRVLGPPLLGRGGVAFEEQPPFPVELPQDPEVDEGDEPDVGLVGAPAAAPDLDARVPDLGREADADAPLAFLTRSYR